MNREEFISKFRREIMGIILDGWVAGKESGTERAWRYELLAKDANRILGKAFDELSHGENGILKMNDKRRIADGEL